MTDSFSQTETHPSPPEEATAFQSDLLERFRSLGNAVLLGSQSFWEGVDVRGMPTAHIATRAFHSTSDFALILANTANKRLQAANDAGDMEDIRQFSTPEVAAEIQLQFQVLTQVIKLLPLQVTSLVVVLALLPLLLLTML